MLLIFIFKNEFKINSLPDKITNNTLLNILYKTFLLEITAL